MLFIITVFLMVSSNHMVTTTKERPYALNIHLEKQLSAQHAQNQVKRCQKEGNGLEGEHAVVTCEGGAILWVWVSLLAGYQGDRNSKKKK